MDNRENIDKEHKLHDMRYKDKLIVAQIVFWVISSVIGLLGASAAISYAVFRVLLGA